MHHFNAFLIISLLSTLLLVSADESLSAAVRAAKKARSNAKRAAIAFDVAQQAVERAAVDVDIAERRVGMDAVRLRTLEQRQASNPASATLNGTASVAGNPAEQEPDSEGIPQLKQLNAYGSGTYDNSKNRANIVRSSTKLSGQYYIHNVATGAYLWWSIHPQTIIPSKSSRSAMTLRSFGVGTQVHPTPSNGKCLAAQWNSDRGVDWAGVMYACQTASSKTSSSDAKEKQQWHFLPVAGTSNQYYLIPENHLDDMRTRALSSSEVNTSGGYKSTTVDIFNDKDKNQKWYVTSV